MPEGARTGSEPSDTAASRSSLFIHLTPGNGAPDGASGAAAGGTALAIHHPSWTSADFLLAIIGGTREGDDLELIASLGGEDVDLKARWFWYPPVKREEAVDALVVASLPEA